MVVGMMGAVGQRDFRRVLSFNLVGHIGFTTVGLALWTPAALAASIFYMLHHILAITNLFLVSGLFLRLRRTTQLATLGGLYRSHTVPALFAMVSLFSLAGVPPSSGFVAKLAVVQSALAVGHYWLAGIALVVSLLTLLSMARLWDEGFWKPAPHEAAATPSLGAGIVMPIVLLALLTLGLTVAAAPVYTLALRAAEQVLEADGYVRAVLEQR
jgi:multicomponent Na+:H+ antiporter subunit D